ncbi:hypothetical protein [Tuwongella immobilis]|uniref:Organic solvent tolerance-like N-terminal domain-containing protein n=1 Tax=Tuwongella immobilis TaxID=692036 RepID=A0A6C2YMU2_9BACT|nr:hypothetical protein [Tuwongella immobilis]VIP02433.1 Uncharacterized protein OS=Planctomyces maris DSM 8797 GN=PM8797T_08449 PE=4 SV=1 [Tuwongella immobilis]VTS01383.1 Uncharacterized protein OS=Planctomyces maris DSM 8797 GN=PM8797T_08449 PE=4 SV=1 [Tuwongella immobilis]
MRSTRRLLLYIMAIVSAGTIYTLYSKALGDLDGLPPLPLAYTEEMLSDGPLPVPTVSATDLRLREAFGTNCPEIEYPIKIDVRARGMLVAANHFEINPDGRVRLTEVSVALFGKPKNGHSEIHTVHADIALLEMDSPVKTVAELGSRKILGAELISDPGLRSRDPRVGMIYLVQNRHTPQPEDDMMLRTPGPIYYRDLSQITGRDSTQPNIWTPAVIELTDRQIGPKPTTPATLRLPPTLKDDLRRPNTIAEMMNGSRAPLPTITAEGLKIYLSQLPNIGSNSDKAAPNKPAGPSPLQVRRVEMNGNVQMNLWVDGSSNFLAGDPAEKPQPTAQGLPKPNDKTPASSDRVLIQIETNGPFEYDVEKDIAQYHIASQSNPHLPNHVLVTRHVKPSLRDMMACDDLIIHFKRGGNSPKTEPAAPATATNQPSIQVRKVIATGKSVAVSSDSEQLQAWGYRLVYDAEKSETTLEGDKMIAVKDGNQIEAFELILSNLNVKNQQTAKARGPGKIGMGLLDPTTKSHAQQAVWQEWITFTKEIDPKTKLELDKLALSGGAKFTDKTEQRTLEGRTLTLWLLPQQSAVGSAAMAAPAGTGNDSRKPHRLEAVQQVVLHSPELEITKSDYLNVWFQERPVPKSAIQPIPANAGVNPPQTGNIPNLLPANGLPTGATPLATAQSGGTSVVAQPVGRDATPVREKNRDPIGEMFGSRSNDSGSQREKNPPIRLQSQRIIAWVDRTEKRNDLNRLQCDGDVVVHQDPAKPNARPVDITGKSMTLRHYMEGNILHVIGTEESNAEVHLDQLSLIGADVLIDQRDNLASVKGSGTMRLLSSTNLEGQKLETPTYVDVFWKEGMEFRGGEKWARFEGSVQGVQLNSRVLCETMQVTLDREVWLNQAQKTGQSGKDSPKIDRVICDRQPTNPKAVVDRSQQVVYTDLIRDPKTRKIAKYQSISSRELNLDNLSSKLEAPGPGTVRIFQPGNSSNPAAVSPNFSPIGNGNRPMAANSQTDQIMKLTWVGYKGALKADNKRRMAIFYDDIEVMHFPTENPQQVIDITKIHPDGMHLRCSQSLEVYSHKHSDDKTTMEMIARGNCRIRTFEFDATSEIVKYDESKDTLIFEGEKLPAELVRYKDGVRGVEPEKFKGRKITYYRKTNNFSVDGGTGVTGSIR